MATAEAIKTGEESPIQRALEWIWRGKAMRALRADRPKSSARQLAFLSRSSATIGAARAALEPPLPARHGPMEFVSCELYREAVYWALLAHRAASQPETPADAPRESLEGLFKSTDRTVLEHAAGDAPRLGEIERAIATKDFADFAELPRAEQAKLAQSLEPFAEALSLGIDAREIAIQRIWVRRALVMVALLLLIGLLIWLAVTSMERREQANDLAKNKPWLTSSTYINPCTSPDQSCAKVSGYFFHTAQEPNPWVLVDLEKPTRVSAVRVYNRLDCCQERGRPLVVELSLDQKVWKEVARQPDEFREWKAKFPTSEARFVRLRAEGTNILHFSQVRILP